MNEQKHGMADGSIISTPKPTASSTLEKKRGPRNINRQYEPVAINYSSIIDEEPSVESLGILSDGELDLAPQLETPRTETSTLDDALRKQRLLAQNALNKVSRLGLPSMYLIPSESCRSVFESQTKHQSTVTEADLLKSMKVATDIKDSCFNPNNMSTPRSSNAAVEDKPKSSMYDDVTQISEKIRNSDISLKDLCSELGKCSIGSKYTAQDISGIDSRMFVPAEFASQKLRDDELSWRRERDIPIENSVFSVHANSTAYEEKFSVGDYFKGKSDEMSDLKFLKTSPERKDPVPLIDLTNTLHEADKSYISSVTSSDLQNNSVLSISQIAKILSSTDSLTPTKVVNCLLKKNPKGKDTANSKVRNISETNADIDNFSKVGHSNTYHEIPTWRSSDVRGVQKTDWGRESENVLGQNKIKQNDFKRHMNFESGLEKCGKDSDIKELLKVVNKPETQTLSNTKNSEYNSDSSSERNISTKGVSGEDKENDSQDADRSLTSTRSASSVDTLPEGKFPIKSTRTELTWGCLKLGRSSSQEFFIRNQLQKRIRMQASITGSSFRILKDRTDSEMLTAMTFLLHPMETKSFQVTFCPTVSGASAEKLYFYLIINGEVQHNKRQTLVLYGYGGHALLDVNNIAKDSNGKLWLSLGRLDHKAVVIQKIFLKNTGTLNAFACLDVVSKSLYAFSVLDVQPNEIILKPREKVTVTITYTPAKQDFRNSSNTEVVDIGCLKIISGAEPLRGRLRRLCRKLKLNGEKPDPLLERLSAYYADEAMPSDLRMFKETIGVTKELLQQLTVKEVTLTLEQDLERTLIGHIDIDETSMYQTLGPDVPNFSVMEDVTMKKSNDCKFKVEPSSILLTLPGKLQDTILLHSENINPMPYEVTVDPYAVFRVFPKEGIISPGDTVFIKVSCTSAMTVGRDVGKVSIFVENEVMEVTIKRIFIKQNN